MGASRSPLRAWGGLCEPVVGTGQDSWCRSGTGGGSGPGQKSDPWDRMAEEMGNCVWTPSESRTWGARGRGASRELRRGRGCLGIRWAAAAWKEAVTSLRGRQVPRGCRAHSGDQA